MKPAFKSLWIHSIVFTGFTDLEVTFQDIVKTEISIACNGLNSGYILYIILEYIKYLFLWMNVNGTIPAALICIVHNT